MLVQKTTNSAHVYFSSAEVGDDDLAEKSVVIREQRMDPIGTPICGRRKNDPEHPLNRRAL